MEFYKSGKAEAPTGDDAELSKILNLAIPLHPLDAAIRIAEAHNYYGRANQIEGEWMKARDVLGKIPELETFKEDVILWPGRSGGRPRIIVCPDSAVGSPEDTPWSYMLYIDTGEAVDETEKVNLIRQTRRRTGDVLPVDESE